MDKSLLVTLEYPPQKGGIANYLANLYSRLPSDKITVLAPKCKGDREYDRAVNYKIIRGHLLSFYIWPRWLPLYFRVKHLVKKNRIKMIHLSHILPVGYIAYRLSKHKKLKIRYIAYLHGLDILKAQENPRKKQMVIKILQSASGIVTNSEYTRGLVRELGIPDNKVLVVYPCPANRPPKTTVETYDVLSKYGLGNKRVILSVGRLVKRKGVDKVIEALPKLYEGFKDIMYVIVGDGPELGNLAKRVQELGMQNIVRFVGEVSNDDLIKFYTIAELFIMPSRKIGSDVEGFGTVYLEANLFGLPVIGGDSGGVPEAIIHERTGLLVDGENENQIYEAMRDLLSNKDWAQTLGQNGKVRAENDFQWRKETEKLRLYLGGHTYG